MKSFTLYVLVDLIIFGALMLVWSAVDRLMWPRTRQRMIDLLNDELPRTWDVER